MAPSSSPLSPGLLQNLEHLLLDLYHHQYPEVPCPQNTTQRASVALILRIQPHFSHWPTNQRNEQPGGGGSPPPSAGERIKTFFSQEWVRHGDPEVLFIKRATRQGDKWNGHVALPGGRRDPEDANDQAAAIREAWEEVGLKLSEDISVPTGNLPQRVMTGWAGEPLMVICPYVFLLTAHNISPLRLQPSEVASTHWVPLRALLSRKQRTVWCQNVSKRTSGKLSGWKQRFHRLSMGDMILAAIRLVPSESTYCTSIAEFLPTEEPQPHEQEYANATVPLLGARRYKAPSPVDKPLLLWGLTLGILGDFLEMLPPHDVIRTFVYPSFTPLDLRFILWLLSYRFRKHKQRQLEAKYRAAGRSLIDGRYETSMTADSDKSGEVGYDEYGLPRYYGRLRADKRGNQHEQSGWLDTEYSKIVRKAVWMTTVCRLAVALALGRAILRSHSRWNYN